MTRTKANRLLRVKPKSTDVARPQVESLPPQLRQPSCEFRQTPRRRSTKEWKPGSDNDFQKAAEQFEKAVSIYPAYDAAFNNLGVMYYQMNQTEKARAAFEQSVALNDRNADADRNLARILIHDGNYQRAEELAEEVADWLNR